MQKKIQIILPAILVAATMLACVMPTLPDFSTGLTGNQQDIPTQPVQPPMEKTPLPQVISDTQDQLISVYESVNPGVVAIQVLTNTGDSLGSGFVYDKQGHIITNYHVVEGATELEVDFPSGYKTTASVIDVDTDSDIAVIKADAPEEYLMPLSLGDSDQVKVGQTVVAIGNPFGLSSTMTMGIVSALGRTLDSAHSSPDGQLFTAGDLIQTDASINPGNSGGPLINLNGEVIGINRAIRTSGNAAITGDAGNIGIGFAISINIAKRVVPVLITEGEYEYPYLGLSSLPEISLTAQRELGLDRAIGAYVVGINPGGPADTAGLAAGTSPTGIEGLYKGGDLIIAIDDRTILTFGDLLKYLINTKSPGDTVVLTILRDGQEKEISLTLGSRP